MNIAQLREILRGCNEKAEVCIENGGLYLREESKMDRDRLVMTGWLLRDVDGLYLSLNNKNSEHPVWSEIDKTWKTENAMVLLTEIPERLGMNSKINDCVGIPKRVNIVIDIDG